MVWVVLAHLLVIRIQADFLGSLLRDARLEDASSAAPPYPLLVKAAHQSPQHRAQMMSP